MGDNLTTMAKYNNSITCCTPVPASHSMTSSFFSTDNDVV